MVTISMKQYCEWRRSPIYSWPWH